MRRRTIPDPPPTDEGRPLDPSFRFWRGGVFDAEAAGRKAIPVQDDAGVWRDFFTGAPVAR